MENYQVTPISNLINEMPVVMTDFRQLVSKH